jgi:hypothetical protein
MRLYNEELYDMHSSPNVVGLMKSRSMGQVGHVAQTGER